MSFRLVPNSVTLDDLERRRPSSPSHRVISPNSVAVAAHYVKVVEGTPILSATEMYSRSNAVFSKSVKLRHSPLASENLTNDRSHNLKTVQDRS